MSKNKCNVCGMIRAIKDLVLLENGTYICFSCWNNLDSRATDSKNEK